MFARLTHAGIAFFITALAYQGYAVVVVPLVEPTRNHLAADNDAGAAGGDYARSLDKHRSLLATYLPPTHWSLQRPPKTIESGHALIVLDDFQQSQDGKLRIRQCVVIYFPGGRQRGALPPRDAIVLEAPQGAVLQMDDPASAGPATLGRIQWGELRGPIHIFSDMQQPGPGDDLRLITRDLRLNESGLSTREAVEMQLGEHRGRGRGLEIRRLSTVSKDRGDASHGVLHGLDVLEISSEVAVELSATDLRLFGKRLSREPTPLALSNASDGRPAAQAGPSEEGPTPPVRIKCTGPFRFDFANNKASFLENVSARQIEADGQLNELLADELNLYLITTGRRPDGSTDKPEASELAGQLAPGTLEAKGAPVRLDAPSYETSVVGHRLRIQIPQRLITVDGGDEAVLKFREGEIHAPMVQYRIPAPDTEQKLGEMSAAGRGWLRALVAKDRPHEPLEVSWATSMRISRETGAPVLSVIGRPRLRMPGVGSLMADQMHVYFQEHGPNGPAAVTPDRLVASGAVSIDSPELSCRVNGLTMWIAYQQAAREKQGDNDRVDNQGSLSSRLRRANRRAYAVSGDKLALLVTIRDREPDVTRVSVDGNVVFQESAAGEAGPPPLRVVARQLRVDEADTPDAKITILGSPAAAGQPAQAAEITVGGATLRAESLRLNRGESKAWIDAPGEVLLAIDRDLSGSPLENPERLVITWRDSMKLEEDRITFAGAVLAKTAAGWLQSPRLVARLSAPVRFDGGAAGSRPELQQIQCYDGVRLKYDVVDEAGVTARQRAELRTLAVNLATGKIEGDGPGQIESVHLATGNSPLAKLAGQNGGPSSEPPQRLRYLQTLFNRGVTGNLHRRVVQLHGNVRTIYGPVDAWEQTLRLEPGQEPAPHTVHLECETLGVAESPSASLFTPPGGGGGLGPLELTAEGRVTIEGQTPEHGAFTARGARATYDQLKTMFVLEGLPNDPAKIWRQEYVGAPHTVGSAQKIQYWLNTGRASGKGFRWEIHQFQ